MSRLWIYYLRLLWVAEKVASGIQMNGHPFNTWMATSALCWLLSALVDLGWLHNEVYGKRLSPTFKCMLCYELYFHVIIMLNLWGLLQISLLSTGAFWNKEPCLLAWGAGSFGDGGGAAALPELVTAVYLPILKWKWAGRQTSSSDRSRGTGIPTLLAPLYLQVSSH